MSVSEQTVGLWWQGAFDPAVSLGERIQRAGVLFADRPAVRLADGGWLTHGTLHTRAEPVRRAIARSLAERGGAVGCLTGTNESLTIALIAALTTAPGMTVLDPSLPAARNRQALDDIGARTLLADRTTVGVARSLARDADEIVMLDAPDDGVGASPPVVDEGVLTIFTSGSTGRAKGVRRPYTAMAHTSYNISWRCESTPEDVMLYVGSPGHVGTLNDVLLSILNGFAAVPVQLADLDLAAIYALIRDLGVGKISMPPSLMRLLLRHAANHGGFDRDLMFCSSGEALLRSDVRLFFEVLGAGSRLWQSYGSTEAGHMFAGFYGPEHAAGKGSLPLNSAARGVEVEVLGEDGGPVGVGETGQIRVRTPSLALGYTGGDGAAGGFGSDDRGRYFMTGDRALVLGPGEFVIEGRADRQINLHGRRVELGEVESAILGTPGWGEACAALVEDGAGRTTLLAMVSPIEGEAGDVAALRATLQESLPAFAVPARLVSTPALPRTTTGKVDLTAVKDALAGSMTAARGSVGRPPKGSTENWVADAWQEVLGVEERPSRDVPFDEFGGDSLNAVELCLRFGEKFGVRLGMDFVTAHRTVASQAGALQDAADGSIGGERVVRLRSDGDGPICVLVPGAGGHAWVYLGIAGGVDRACDLLALNLNSADRAGLSAERLAAAVLQSMANEDRSRPVIVVGYSRGCLIACSLARALAARGGSGGGVALIDPSPVGPEAMGAQIQRAARGLVRSVRGRRAGAGARGVLDEQIDATRRRIGRMYRPGATRLPDGPCWVLATGETAGLIRARGLLYGRAVGGLDLKVVDGLDHLDLMRKRGAPIAASWLSARIDQVMENARG